MTSTLADPVTAPAGAADLLLVRLLATAKAPPAPNVVRAALDRYLPRALTADQWDELVRAARAAGLVTPRGLSLTAEGRARALAVLGLTDLPARCPWRTLEARYLAPVAAGFEAGGKAPNAEQLAARALADRLGLPVPAGATLPQVFVAMLGKELGIPGETDWSRLRRRALSRLAGSEQELGDNQIRKVLPRKVLEAPGKGASGLRARVIRDWLARRAASPAPAPASESTFDPEAFAATVRAAARHCPTGRYGGNKVFISHLWRYLQAEPGVPRMDLPAFKRRLIEANAAGRLELTRADLVQDMDPADVRESEAQHLTATFHFVLIPGGSPP